MARTGESVAQVCTAPPVTESFEPDATRHAVLAERHLRFQRLYDALGPEMQGR
jgi:xylulokinase